MGGGGQCLILAKPGSTVTFTFKMKYFSKKEKTKENKKKVYTKSKAVFQIINTLGGLRKILLIYKSYPRKILDHLYDFVPRNRFLLWKPLESCPVPSREITAKYLT